MCVTSNGIEAAFRDDDRRARLQRMAHAEFEDRIGVGGRQVRHDEIGGVQHVVHRNVDLARMQDFVRSHAVVARGDDRRLDDVAVAPVEVELLPRSRIGLLPETHNDETGWHPGPAAIVGHFKARTLHWPPRERNELPATGPVGNRREAASLLVWGRAASRPRSGRGRWRKPRRPANGAAPSV